MFQGFRFGASASGFRARRYSSRRFGDADSECWGEHSNSSHGHCEQRPQPQNKKSNKHQQEPASPSDDHAIATMDNRAIALAELS